MINTLEMSFMSVEINIVTTKRIAFDIFEKLTSGIFSKSQSLKIIKGHASFEVEIGTQLSFIYEERANIDALPDTVISAMEGIKWLYTVSCSSAPDYTKELAELSIAIAKEGVGLVFDGANEEILFNAATVKGISKRKRESKYLNLVVMKLFYDPRMLTNEFPAKLINFFQTKYKQFLPTSIEDFPKSKKTKLPSNDYSAFESMWNTLSMREIRGILNWYCKNGKIEGCFFSPDKREWNKLDPFFIKVSELTLRFDSSLLECEQVQDIFLQLCKLSVPFYGCVFVIENIKLIGKTQFYEKGITEDYYMGTAGRWQGLPQELTWLSWFGTSYRELLRENLFEKEFVKEDSATGTFVSLGNSFMTKRELKKIQSFIPAPLVMPTTEIPEVLV